jgi:hypothetical protein
MRHATPVIDQPFIARLIDQSAVRAKVGTGDVPLKCPASKFAINRLDFVIRMLFREFVIACLFQCDPQGLLRGHMWNFERVATETVRVTSTQNVPLVGPFLALPSSYPCVRGRWYPPHEFWPGYLEAQA